MKMREKVIMNAEDLGWDILKEEPEQYKIRFVQQEVRIDVWYSKMTVAVLQRGHAPKYYRFVSDKKLDELLDNPQQIER